MITAAGPATQRERAAAWIERTHDEVTAFFEALDGGGRFREDRWERPGGGGGVSRLLEEGTTFEKAGVNRSLVHGELPAAAAEKLGGGRAGAGVVEFFATGVSLVVHPRSPLVPTVHLNVRYLELADERGAVLDAWFGGGTDLTPTYPFPEDAAHFHRALRRVCDGHGAGLYPRFKAWCDNYFVNEHRGGERRGVGGVFFDHLRPGDEGMDTDALFAFAGAVGLSLKDAYGPLVRRRRDQPYGQRERDFQLVRRGRYVEFNLVHDRGTTFGLRTNARVESVLMSLPPLAAWGYAQDYPAGTFEARLIDMLVPRGWADADEDEA